MDCHTGQLCYPLPSISVVLSSPVPAPSLPPFSRGKATVISSQSLCLSFPVGRRSLLAVGRSVVGCGKNPPQGENVRMLTL